jgi:hypothetical protein
VASIKNGSESVLRRMSRRAVLPLVVALLGCDCKSHELLAPAPEPERDDPQPYVRVEIATVWFGVERVVTLADRPGIPIANRWAPLKEKLDGARKREEIGQDLSIVVDADVPFRLLSEVLLHAQVRDVDHFSLYEGKLHAPRVSVTPWGYRRLPVSQGLNRGGQPRSDSLRVLVHEDGGVSFTCNVKAGCVVEGPDVTFTRVDGQIDLASIVERINQLLRLHPELNAQPALELSAEPETPYHLVAEVARGVFGLGVATPFSQMVFIAPS